MSHPRRKSADPKVDFKSELAVSEISPASSPSPSHMNFLSAGIHYMNLLIEVGKLGFVNVLGNKFNPTSLPAYGGEEALPGIMTLDIVPTVGRSANINSGVNLAAKDTFTGIRRQNMGTIPYDPADVMLYMLAIDSILSIMAHIRRAFRVVGNFDWKNRYTSDALLWAMGFIPDTLRSGYGDFVARYDLIVTKAQRLVYLRDFPLLNDHAMLFSEVYRDTEDERAQFYVPRPSGYYQMTLLPENPKQVLEFIDLIPMYDNVGGLGMISWLNYVEGMINNIAYVNTYSNIAGQIEKAFGPNTATLPLSGDLNPLEPLYDKSFGWILQNSTPIALERGESMRIYESLAQDNNLGALISKPKYSSTIPEYEAMLYTNHDTLSSDEVFQASRWKVCRTSEVEDPMGLKEVVIGTDVLERCVMFFYDYTSGYPYFQKKIVPNILTIFGSAAVGSIVPYEDVVEQLSVVGMLTNFKWYPYLNIVGKMDPMSEVKNYVSVFGNVDNYNKISHNQIELLQDVRQLESFYMAQITTIT